MTGLDQARDNNLLPKIGASTTTITRDNIQNLPQADNTPIDKVILQLPGVSYDSAVSNPNFHVRNEYANVQIRINGVVLPEGVSALGPLIDTNFVGSMSLLTGTLPAQYGLRTAGVLDITSRSFAAPGGDISLYGGSWQTITPSFDYEASATASTSSRRAAIGTISGSKTPRQRSTPSMTRRSRASSSAMPLRCSTNRHAFPLFRPRLTARSRSRTILAKRRSAISARQMPIRRRSTKTNTIRTSPISRPGNGTAVTATRKSRPIRATPRFISFPT
jgi:hypothetical protein